MSQTMKQPNAKRKKLLNVLLIGETGVGKSTFVNAFINYLTFNSLEDALKSDDIVSLIPTKFLMADENLQEKQISFGSDPNETFKDGESSTQSVKSYKIITDDKIIRLIDTPGMGDTRGINKDKENFDALLTVISELRNIHAICIFLKPNDSRLTVLFDYCVKQLLSRLHRDASKNFLFVFTNSRGTFYRPGDTLPILKSILKTMKENPPHTDIPFTKDNVFCIDNEAFRFLVAQKNGIRFTDREKQDFSTSWDNSSSECDRLLSYAQQIKPHKVKDTVSVNEAKRLIVRLSKPLAEITENIENNLRNLDTRKAELNDRNKSIDELKGLLNIPVVKVRVKVMERPKTVCTHPRCMSIQGPYHEKCDFKICHDPCLLNNVPEKLIGDTLLQYCFIIDKHTGICTNCGHSYLSHMHMYYNSETYTDQVEDKNVSMNIEREEDLKREIRTLIVDLEGRKAKYNEEKEIIVRCMAEFSHFLKNNAIVTYSDKYKEYIEHLINKENSLGDAADSRLLDSYKSLLKTYDRLMAYLDEELKRSQEVNPASVVINAKKVLDNVKSLQSLNLTGGKIEEFNLQQGEIYKHVILKKNEVEVNASKSQELGDTDTNLQGVQTAATSVGTHL